MSGFEASASPGGAHHFLARLEGEWSGQSRLWFEPDVLADESPVQGSVRLVLDGRFALHEYVNTIDQQRVEGIMLIGCDLSTQRFELAWADSFHNGTKLMLSTGESGAAHGALSVLGSYSDLQGGPDWGWRTTIELADDGQQLLLRHFNISPQGAEALAVEFAYHRISAG